MQTKTDGFSKSANMIALPAQHKSLFQGDPVYGSGYCIQLGKKTTAKSLIRFFFLKVIESTNFFYNKLFLSMHI
jgi:hypothetical protein